MRTRIEAFMSVVKREGKQDLINFLSSSDFYSAPCSTKFHLAVTGGLAQHTVNVIKCAEELNEKYGKLYPDESIVLAALGHDLCKVNFYALDEESPTDAQITFLRSLCAKAGIAVPTKLNKTYASTCIDHLKSMKKLPLPALTPSFVVKDQMPLGHGEKSLFILQQFVKLTLDEALAIRWHMATFDAGIHFPYPSGFAFNEALKQSKLLSILILADMEASNLREV